MANTRLPRALCKAVADLLHGSHGTLDALFETSGAPGAPPSLSHAAKWKEWLFRTGNTPDVDSLQVLGNILEEFMDIPPEGDDEAVTSWQLRKIKVVSELEAAGLRYYRGGRIFPVAEKNQEEAATQAASSVAEAAALPQSIDALLEVLLKGLRRSMYPLTNRRRGAQSLSFSTEYDVQDILHALMRPWIADSEITPRQSRGLHYVSRSKRLERGR